VSAEFFAGVAPLTMKVVPFPGSDVSPQAVQLPCRRSETAAFNHFDERSELIEIETAHGYKRRLLFPSK
jgi:hypothetical protein